MSTPRLFGISYKQMLAVLIIIGVMFAILYPVFQKVREPHPRGCHSNLNQLGLAFIQYSQDADEKFPPGVNALNNGWAGQIYPYVKSVAVYHCPNDSQVGHSVSYAENQRIAGQSLENFTSPAHSVAVYEETTLNCDPSIPETVSATGLTAPQSSTRHDPLTFGLNYLAVDGHVRMLKPGQISSGLHAVPPKLATDKGYSLTFAIKSPM